MKSMRINIPKEGSIIVLTEDWKAKVRSKSTAARNLFKSLPNDTAGKAYMRLAGVKSYERVVTIPAGTELEIIYIHPKIDAVRLNSVNRNPKYGLIVSVDNASEIEYEPK